MERIAKSQRRLTAYKRHELLSGVCTYPLPEFYSGYGDAAAGQNGEDLTPYITHEMKADWADNRELLLKLWRGEIDDQEIWHDAKPWLCLFPGAGELPWAARVFDFDFSRCNRRS